MSKVQRGDPLFSMDKRAAVARHQGSPASTRSAASRQSARPSISPGATRSIDTPSNRSPQEPDSLQVSPSSSLQEERPIRPLPKKRLRDRLSVEQAETIIFPSVPEHQPLFSFPYTARDENAPISQEHARGAPDGQAPGVPREWSDAERMMEIEAYARSHSQTQLWRDSEKPLKKATGQMHRPQSRYVMHGKGKPSQSSIGESVNSSLDGDEGFENTNNKKKRKIPQSNGSLSMNHASLASELAATHISKPRTDVDGVAVDAPSTDRSGTYYGSGAPVGATASELVSHRPSMPLSQITPNRVRRPGSRRASHERRQGGYVYGKEQTVSRRTASTKAVNSQILSSSPAGQGIISSAIANAQAQEHSSPVRGAQGVSLLSQEIAQKSSPQAGNFTFTCESASSNKFVWPGNTSMALPDQAYPIPPSQGPDPRRGAPPVQRADYLQGQHPQSNQPLPPPRKTRPRRPGRVYEIAAKQRRINQAWANQQHPPRAEDLWICQFCEYEAIFGTPPLALIRQYEIKDRKAQKALAERRRMLDKVKQKGRKNKKNAKASHKSLAHQAAEFQKREFLRNTGGLPHPQDGHHDPMARNPEHELYHPDDIEYDDDYYDDDRHILADEGEEYEPINDQDYYESDFDENDVPPLLPPDQHYPQTLAGPSTARPPVMQPYLIDHQRLPR